jgi:hypothetical protein
MGGECLTNGALIAAAEEAGFEVLLTTDKSIRHQQNLKARRLAIVALQHSQWPMVKLVSSKIVAAVESIEAGGYMEVEVPFID